MRLIIDTVKKTLIQENDGERSVIGLYSKEAFDEIHEKYHGKIEVSY